MEAIFKQRGNRVQITSLQKDKYYLFVNEFRFKLIKLGLFVDNNKSILVPVSIRLNENNLIEFDKHPNSVTTNVKSNLIYEATEDQIKFILSLEEKYKDTLKATEVLNF